MSFIRMEIKAGEIDAIQVGRGRRRVYRIPFGEAMRYMRRLGLLSLLAGVVLSPASSLPQVAPINRRLPCACVARPSPFRGANRS
jgi:hypothetical protein